MRIIWVNDLKFINVNQLFGENVIQRNDELNDKIKSLNSQNLSYDKKTKTLEFRNIEFEEILFKESLLELSSNVKLQANMFIVFNNCKFNKIEFIKFDVPIGKFPKDNIDYKDDIRGIEFNWNNKINQSLEIKIKNSKFYGKFYINKQYDNNDKKTIIKELEIKETLFEENFKLNNCEIKKIFIKDSDFKKNVYFYNCEFNEGTDEKKRINFRNVNFKGLTLFGDCEFSNKTNFKYVTFESHAHFRDTNFNKGLNLDYANIEKEMNFFDVKGLDSKISKLNTSQETYRIIKHQFEKLNNKIESNKYHALEMEQHRKNIWEKIFNDCNSFYKLLPDGIVSFVHWLSSNHSSNWSLALFWIFIVSFITTFNLGLDVSIDNIFKYINILSKIEDFNNSYIAMTLNKLSLGYLYYQFLTAVRKDTRK